MVFEVGRPAAPAAGAEIVFQVAVVGAGIHERRDGRRGERRPAQVRVHQNAGAVDDRLEAGRTQTVNRATHHANDGGKVRHL